MKLLVDESLPRGLKRELSAQDVATVAEMGWAGRSNGELMELAEDDFDVFLTADQGLPYQQSLSGSKLAVVVLAAKTNRLEDLRPPAYLNRRRVLVDLAHRMASATSERGQISLPGLAILP